jgi:hypothetical protein
MTNKVQAQGNVLRTAVVLAVGAAVACADQPEHRQGAAVRDSSGAVLVEYALAGTEVVGPCFDSDPIVRIGDRHEDPSHDLHRVAGAVETAAGSIVIATGSYELRIYGRDGQHQTTLGRLGDGPGEFRQIKGIYPFRGDSIAVFDEAQQRVTVLALYGSGARVLNHTEFQDPSNPRHFQVVGTVADSQVVVQHIIPATPREGVVADSLLLTTHGPRGKSDWSLEPIARAETQYDQGTRGLVFSSPLFGRSTHTSAAGDHVHVCSDYDRVCRTYDSNGVLIAVLRPSGAAVQIDAELVAAKLDERLASFTPAGRVRAEAVLKAHVPNDLPPFISIASDARGRLWVKPVNLRRNSPWIVTSERGAYTLCSMSDGMKPLSIGAETVLVLGHDIYDVEMVSLHSLRPDMNR